MENQEESIKLPGKKASEEDKSWHEFVRAQQQKEAERVEDAAKYLSGMIGIAFAIFLKTDADAFSHQASSGTVTWAAGLWLLSLCISFFIFFPWKYAYSYCQHGLVLHCATATRFRLFSTYCHYPNE